MEEKLLEHKTSGGTDRVNEALYYLTFILWPFGVMLASLKRWNRPWSKNVFWLFCIFFGFAFIIAKVGGAADSDRYAQLFVQYAHSDLSLNDLLSSLYSESSNYVDIAQPLITYLVSRISNNPSVLFAVFGLIFGYFYSRNIWFVLGKISGHFTAVDLLYILTFILINPIWNINGFRMWTAAQIFLFGALPYLLDGKSKRLIWSGVSIFFHFSFLFPLIILFLFMLLRNRLNIIVFFFVITSFIKELDLQLVQSALSFLPDFLQPRIGAYTDVDYAEAIRIERQSLNWYVTFSDKALTWVTYIMIVFISFYYRKFLNSRKDLMTLLCYSLLLYGFANIASLVPSMDRFLAVGNTFVFSFLIIFISISPKSDSFSLIKGLSVPLLLLFCIVAIRIGMDFYGLATLFGNPFFVALDSDPVPLITGIKRLF